MREITHFFMQITLSPTSSQGPARVLTDIWGVLSGGFFNREGAEGMNELPLPAYFSPCAPLRLSAGVDVPVTPAAPVFFFDDRD
jgi:hypothetical protein